ncbi:hypothetical protein N7509_013046 [Penicillium cosmopolitanum]|uniref:AT hook motif protein n=1 Tax=Penicillium cosmopolitanum TaxID=1131564 RepID=A0A9W9SD22_9EURO|nr:uncharacterized protein N7509_013046 [Penicillium cosmopolitanum]KAJ5376160.1 hypothetical protein N7509_013046 [Penicillium cosmopolitanum]
MPRVWNAEADAKLFCGVLAQLQDTNTRLDYDALAKYMGPDCVVGAVKNRMNRLKAAARSEGPTTPSVECASSPASVPDSASPPVKRKWTPGPRKPRSKKPKNEQRDENPPKMEMDPLGLKEEGDEALVVKYEEGGKEDTFIKTDPEETEDDPSVDV